MYYNFYKRIKNKIVFLWRKINNRKKINELIESGDYRLKKIGTILNNLKDLSYEQRIIRDKVESLRSRLINKSDKLKYDAKVASKDEIFCVMLMKIISDFNCKNGLEFGTCIGISTSYQAAAMKKFTGGNFITMEGEEYKKDIAIQNFKELGLDNVKLNFGRFEDILPIILEDNKEFDYVFIDGDHQHHATVLNFKKILPNLKESAIVIIDDIRWSEGMERAWHDIKNNDSIEYSIDLFSIGICFIGKTDNNKEFKAYIS